MTTAPTPEEVRALADACACDWHAVRPHLVVDALRRLQAENERLRAELEARKPLPPDVLADKCEAWLQAGGAANIVDAFEAGYRAAEET